MLSGWRFFKRSFYESVNRFDLMKVLPGMKDWSFYGLRASIKMGLARRKVADSTLYGKMK